MAASCPEATYSTLLPAVILASLRRDITRVLPRVRSTVMTATSLTAENTTPSGVTNEQATPAGVLIVALPALKDPPMASGDKFIVISDPGPSSILPSRPRFTAALPLHSVLMMVLF